MNCVFGYSVDIYSFVFPCNVLAYYGFDCSHSCFLFDDCFKCFGGFKSWHMAQYNAQSTCEWERWVGALMEMDSNNNNNTAFLKALIPTIWINALCMV